MDDDLRWGDRLFRLENRHEVERVLTKRFHAVVGNPPYITEKDASKRKKYRDLYDSAALASRRECATKARGRSCDLGTSKAAMLHKR